MYTTEGARRMFALKTEEVAEDWRKLHSAELYKFYSPTNSIRMVR
jgi:hypothetical protein